MLIACILIKHFPFKIHLEHSPSLENSNVLIVSKKGRKASVLDISDKLTEVAIGCSLTHALGRYPKAIQIEADLPKYQRRFDKLLDELEGVSPLVEGSSLGCF